MSRRDLSEKYGRNKNSTALINAAIRAEIPGGGLVIDAVNKLRNRNDLGPPGSVARLALAMLRDVLDVMAAEIRQRYDMLQPDDDASEA